MSVKFTEEQLNNFDKAMLIQLFLNQQEQLESIDNKMQLLLEQMADMNRQRFGRSSEKSDESNQLSFTIEDGEIIFNAGSSLPEIGSFVNVRLTRAEPYDLYGELL